MPKPEVIALIVLALIILSIFSHWLMMRLLAWRGISYVRTSFGRGLLFDTQDADGTPVRLLNVDGTFQSACYLVPELWDELVCMYHRTSAEVVENLPRLRRAVVIGGGGFSFPKWLVTHMKPVHVDAVEIDAKVIELAREKFELARLEQECPDSINVICDDGWGWLKQQTELFDLLVNDAFSGNRPLGPLATDEGAALIHKHLSADGVYLANVRAPLEGRKSSTLYETLDVFANEFAYVWYVPEAPEEPERLGNNVLVASDINLVACDCAVLEGHQYKNRPGA